MMMDHLKSDLPASFVVFFVALPLCLGIALASGAPLFSGIIAGIVGGIVVGLASGSPLGVTGPAAGLAVIVLNATSVLSWPAFLLAVLIAGAIQVILGFFRAGYIAYFFPSSVIKGMLTGIGFLIILKQIPFALGYDKENLVDFSLSQTDGMTTFATISKALEVFTPGAVVISFLSLALLLFWDAVLAKKYKIFQVIQGPIVVVLLGILFNSLLLSRTLRFSISPDHLVNLPSTSSLSDFIRQFTLPDFTSITNFQVWKFSIILAIVASLESLLCVEATDKLDPYRRVTPINRELKAQGLGNIISGLCGGLPVAQVVVRSSANITFGGKTKLSTIMHGILLLISVITLVDWLNEIPLASLAAILILVGYKLANPTLFRKMYSLGGEQFIPFCVTIIGILTTDLLKGITIGLICSIFYTLYHSYRNAYYMKDVMTVQGGHEVHHLVLAEEVSFFNKASIKHALDSIPPHSVVIIDCSKSKSIAYDVVEFIRDYKKAAPLKKIEVETIKFIEPI